LIHKLTATQRARIEAAIAALHAAKLKARAKEVGG
jgi:hypothetical protein